MSVSISFRALAIMALLISCQLCLTSVPRTPLSRCHFYGLQNCIHDFTKLMKVVEQEQTPHDLFRGNNSSQIHRIGRETSQYTIDFTKLRSRRTMRTLECLKAANMDFGVR
mmetsp:Transcript_336/g.2666  ORF Transcript_336/g.2666 Transcript_336/m.2666 type:complete len:111 (-) Transcript_336:320-652(-)